MKKIRNRQPLLAAPLVAALLLAALLLVALGCEPPTQPIFYTLETEDPIDEGRGLREDLNAVKIVTTGTRYFLAAGSLFTRLPGPAGSAATTWAVIPPPQAGALCTTIEVWDDGSGLKLWAGWYDTLTGAGLGLYSLNANLSSWTASSWTPQSNGGITGSGVQIGFLAAPQGPGPGTELLVATSSAPGSHVLHYHDGVGLDTGGALIPSSSSAIVDAAWQELPPAKYWVVAGTALYAGDSGAGALAQQSITGITDTGAKFGGVLYDAVNNDLYLSTHSGTLLRYANLATATTSAAMTVDTDAGPVRFTRFVNVAGTTTPGEIYVGSRGYGFFLIPNDVTGVTTASRRPASNLSGLYNGAVNAFLLDTTQSPHNLFVCTSGAGLWRGTFSTGSYTTNDVTVPAWSWNQERETD